jgi:ABC-type bacteriocin/lantibiotic exporter with double-glycine peptidase domain
MIRAVDACGQIALLRVARRLGLRVSFGDVLKAAPRERWGSSLLSLARGARALGLPMIPARASFAGLLGQATPMIVHMRRDHFDTLLSATQQDVRLAGWLGERRLSRTDFERAWSGAVLVLDPDERGTT